MLQVVPNEYAPRGRRTRVLKPEPRPDSEFRHTDTKGGHKSRWGASTTRPTHGQHMPRVTPQTCWWRNPNVVYAACPRAQRFTGRYQSEALCSEIYRIQEKDVDIKRLEAREERIGCIQERFGSRVARKTGRERVHDEGQGGLAL